MQFYYLSYYKAVLMNNIFDNIKEKSNRILTHVLQKLSHRGQNNNIKI